MSDFLSQRVTVADNVLVRELEGESIVLDLSNENYYGLDEIGTKMWQTLASMHTIQDAYNALLQEYDVEPEQLRQDLEDLVAQLVENGLLILHGVHDS